jgi:hypothetical protein
MRPEATSVCVSLCMCLSLYILLQERNIRQCARPILNRERIYRGALSQAWLAFASQVKDKLLVYETLSY